MIGARSEDWLIECRDLSVRRGDRLVVRDAHLTIRAGECVTIVGPNGCGKTSLMLAMLGVLPLQRGAVRFNGLDIRRLPHRLRGRLAAYVPQVVERLPEFTVYDVVCAGRYAHLRPLRPPSAADERIVQRALALCGLEALAQRPVNAISGGERQMTLLAGAIAQDAQALFLDEPCNGLDPAYQVKLVELLRAWRGRQRAVVVISHDLQLPAALGGRVVGMREGRIVADGPVAEVLRPGFLEKLFDAPFQEAWTAEGFRHVLARWPEPASARPATPAAGDGTSDRVREPARR